MTPLQQAVMYKQPEMVQLLIDHGADLDKTASIDHPSPVFLAATYARPQMVEMLLNAGACMNAKKEGKPTLLYYAVTGTRERLLARMRRARTVKAVLDAGTPYSLVQGRPSTMHLAKGHLSDNDLVATVCTTQSA
ncbi:predicted protein [Uncinocarpus reesii 1704]|uniref:Uncharacterized protein n=1 Tax=Uncinocarpus reesii (strain UAMH 1704) TaxID=336963 RepID=C4JKN1_UNCRE|nr:uncharacterized protein UREG_00328 [Uncinocarpus reesii 1704]EEP75482.1 predicted protein [Uncinocarpus reesii 1704]